MGKDILSRYGPDSSRSSVSRARSGGVKKARDVHAYRPPQGPTNINDPKGPGLHGQNFGNAPGFKSGSHSFRESGSPGLHGQNKGHGTNCG